MLVVLLASYVVPRLWRQARRPSPIAFDPSQPYKVFCRDFDVEVESEKLDSVLGPDRASTSEGRFAEVENGLAAWRVRQDFAALEAAARIRAVTSQEVLEDTVVSLLVDHSGSMRGQRMLLAAGATMMASDLLCGLKVKQEVLGFTTVRWKGGLSRQKWLGSGRPRSPGRLNDVLHIIYCRAGQKPIARRYATMLRSDLTKENLDGEALEWAASRLRKCREKHKHIIVVSDGAPVDDSTLNAAEYLENHLRSVISAIGQAGEIQLSAIGINYAVDRYYERSIVIHTPEDLGSAVLQLIEQILAVKTTKTGISSK